MNNRKITFLSLALLTCFAQSAHPGFEDGKKEEAQQPGVLARFYALCDGLVLWGIDTKKTPEVRARVEKLKCPYCERFIHYCVKQDAPKMSDEVRERLAINECAFFNEAARRAEARAKAAGKAFEYNFCPGPNGQGDGSDSEPGTGGEVTENSLSPSSSRTAGSESSDTD